MGRSHAARVSAASARFSRERTGLESPALDLRGSGLSGFAAALAAVSLAACSGTPPPAPTASEPAPDSSRVSWLCAVSPQAVSLQTLGIPADSRPIDLALTPEKVTILLSPARLVTFSRSGPGTVDMIAGGETGSWSAIDRDPTDGSLWVASNDVVSLLQIAESGERRVVAGPHVSGRGGFQQIRITREVIYATPTGADSAVWRLSRTGKLLGQDFAQEREGGPADVVEPLRRNLRLARDLDGNVAAFELRTGQLFRAPDGGAWSPLPDRFPARSPSSSRSLRGEEVGTPSESWYFTDQILGFFFLPEGPALLGSGVASLRARGSVLFRIRDGRIETATEDCARAPLALVASDARGFVAVSTGLVQTLTTGERRFLPGQVLLGRFPARH